MNGNFYSFQIKFLTGKRNFWNAEDLTLSSVEPQAYNLSYTEASIGGLLSEENVQFRAIRGSFAAHSKFDFEIDCLFICLIFHASTVTFINSQGKSLILFLLLNVCVLKC
jgi:hypothetical protein